MARTIGETISELHNALRDYIEASYHIADPALIAQRRRLLDRAGVIHQIPYVESTPRYEPGESFRSIRGLPVAALQAYELLSKGSEGYAALIHDPPYRHQSEAIRDSLVEG